MKTLQEILKRKAELRELFTTRSAELTTEEIDNINKELDELEVAEKEARAKQALDERMAKMQINQNQVTPEQRKQEVTNVLATRGAKYKLKDRSQIELRSAVEGSGQDGVLIPSHLDRVVDAYPWNQVSSVVDLVDTIYLPNGNEYSKAFQVSTDEAAYTLEPTKTGTNSDDGKYHEVGTDFDKVTIKRNKLTAITYESEELELLPDADYASLVEGNVALALKKKLAKEIILGDGTGSHFVGIASASTANMNSNTYTDAAYALDENLLTDIMVDFGGNEDIEGKQVLIMNKQTIKNLARVRGTDKKPVYNIVVTGNTFTIDGYRGVFSAHIKPYDQAEAGEIWAVYGNLGAYKLLNFGGEVIETSKEFKFDQGITAVRGKVFAGGGLAGYKAFLRITKQAAAWLTIRAESSSETLLGKQVSELQNNVVVVNDRISGSLNYVSGYTGFSSLVSEQSGYYLALKVTPNVEGATIKAKVIGGTGREVTLDEDLNIVFRLTSNAQKIQFTITKDGNTSKYVLSLRDLVFEASE